MIYYLSCTGNTYWAAKHLSDATNDRMVSIFDAIEEGCICNLRDGERLGFCLPVHGWRVQPIVEKFIQQLNINSPKIKNESITDKKKIYTYFLLTAGDSCGEYADQLEHLLISKGLEVKTLCSLIMPESYVGLPFMDVDPALRETEKKMNARGIIQKFSDIIIDRRTTRMDITCGKFPKLYSRVLGKFFYKYLITDKRFKVNDNVCIGCGECVKHCPVDNIKLYTNDNKKTVPQWENNGKCLTCMACYHYCPKKAIEFWRFTKNKGQYYYTHNQQNKNETY